MEENLLKVEANFSRGLSQAVSHLISPEEVQVAENFLFNEGGPTVREGTALNASLPYAVTAMKKVYLQNGSSYFAAFAGGQLYISTASGVFNAISGPTMSGDIFMAVYDDALYFSNYSSPVQYYDGTKIDAAGLSSPAFILQISKMDTPDGWTVVGSGIATVDPDTTATHVDIGKSAVKLTTFGIATYGIPSQQNLNQFTSDISSDTNDLISIFTVHDIKANFSSIILGFGSQFPGQDWSGGNPLPDAVGNWANIAHNGFKFLAQESYNYSGESALSVDGVGWTEQRISGVNIYDAGNLCVQGSSFIFANYSNIMNSVNGSNWTNYSMPAPRRWVMGVNGSMVITVDKIVNNIQFYSYNKGQSWTVISGVALWFTHEPEAVIWNNDRFFIFDMLFAQWWLTGNYYSFDGKIWTQCGNPGYSSSLYFQGVAVKNGTVCVATRTAYPSQPAPYNWGASITRDGVTWSTHLLSDDVPTDKNVVAMAANTSFFVMLPANKSYVLFSDSGISWTSAALPMTATWTGATWASGFFYAVAMGTNAVIRSPNASGWVMIASGPAPVLTQAVDLVNLSAWVGCGNDGWALTHVVPKAKFGSQSGFVWASATPYIRVTSIGQGAAATLTVNNLRMTKTPPIVTLTSTTIPTQMFFGSSITTVDRFMSDPMEQTTKGLQLQGQLMSGVIIQDGLTYYKTTLVKVGPNGQPIESNPSFQTSGVFVSNTAIQVVNVLTDIPIASPNWNVVGRRVYRRNANTSTFQYAYQLHNNSTTTFVDRVPMTVLGEALEETGHWPPPNAKFIYPAANQQTYYFNIMESDIKQGSRVRFSQPYTPYYVPLENVFDISPGDGTEGTGMFEFMGMLYFLKERSVWFMDPTTGIMQQSHSTLGCIAPKSLAVGPESAFWLSDEGIVMYQMRYRILSKERMRMDSFFHDLPKQYLKNSAGIFYNNMYLLAVTTSGNTFNDTVVVYDYLNDIWSTFPNVYAQCWTTWQGFQDGYRLFYGNTSGLICEFLTGDFDIGGQNISSRLRTKEFGQASPDAAFQQLYLYTKDLDNQTRTIIVQPYYDWVFTSADMDNILTSNGYGVSKIRLPAKPGAEFFSAEFIAVGRYKIMRMDLYAKQEGLR